MARGADGLAVCPCVKKIGALADSRNVYPTGHATERADPPTISRRQATRFLFWFWAISEWPFGSWIRRQIVDPIRFLGESVTWRNYEASYDVAELEPSSRKNSTYALEEYFVPVERFDDFAAAMRGILRRSHAHLINVSIRHTTADPGSLLAWARTDVFAFVIYYKQGTSSAAKNAVAVWTRELIDAALAVGGSYYLPYQIHATVQQFLRAYPRAPEFFALKRRLDPANKFRNQLWKKYYHPYAN
jgi:FAD/FMN-containing dehydrogenase